jgi:hypothetical protein
MSIIKQIKSVFSKFASKAEKVATDYIQNRPMATGAYSSLLGCIAVTALMAPSFAVAAIVLGGCIGLAAAVDVVERSGSNLSKPNKK